jgi:hypothetical protein
LVNVDYHSDLVDLHPNTALNFQEGTWVNFVDWRFDGTFIWRYPLSECLSRGAGYCHEHRNPFNEPNVARWDCIRKRLGLWGIPWKHVKAVGVSLSPDWTGASDALVEPVNRLRISHWIDDYYRQTNRGRAPRRRQPKFVRVKV